MTKFHLSIGALLTIALLATGFGLRAQGTGLVVTSSNTVGIGTTSPSMNLQIGSGTFPAALPGIGIANGSSSYSFFSASDNTHEYISGIDNTISYGKEGMVSNHDLAIITNNTARLYITNAGNVGIGTTSPARKLEIADGTVPAIAFRNTSQATDSKYWEWSVYGAQFRGMMQNDANSSEAQWLGVNRSGTTILNIIFPNGNVGIGAVTPAQKLSVTDNLSVTNSAGIQYILMGNQDSGGANNPAMIQAANGNLCFGHGSSWSGSGGTFAPTVFFDNNGGNVGIGTTSPGYKLDVSGQVHATSFVSSTTTYADFVFKPDYRLASLNEVEASIKKDGHLPGIPSEEEARVHGIDLTQMQVKLLQKIEELTLHQIEQEKLLQDQATRLDQQSKRIDQLEQENTELRKQP